LENYLELLDASRRMVQTGKTGAIPEHLAPILARLGIRRDMWGDLVTGFDDMFGHLVGTPDKVPSGRWRLVAVGTGASRTARPPLAELSAARRTPCRWLRKSPLSRFLFESFLDRTGQPVGLKVRGFLQITPWTETGASPRIVSFISTSLAPCDRILRFPITEATRFANQKKSVCLLLHVGSNTTVWE
jgi:hypothetical protein